jgi:hypothetical protein
VSADGSIVAWWATQYVELPPYQGPFPDARTYTWNLASGQSSALQPTDNFGSPGYTFASLFSTQSISADGSSFALSSVWLNGSAPRRAFLASQSGRQELSAGFANWLPFLNSMAGPNRIAHAVSADGSTVVGFAIDDFNSGATTVAMRWTRGGAVEILGRPTPIPPGFGPFTIALDVNADGQIIAGSQYLGAMPYAGSTDQVRNARAVYWLNGGHRVLANVLAAEGVDLGGVIPAVITGVSDDGGTMTGYGMSSSSSNAMLVSFVATIFPPGVCDDIDFNRDGTRFDPLDIEAFLSVFSEGPCLPIGASCRDVDFNNDGSLFDPDDVDAFFRVFSEGPCEV